MPNPYHDENGKFCSRNEMEAAIERVAQSGDSDAYIRLKTDFKAATEKPLWEQPINNKDEYNAAMAAWKENLRSKGYELDTIHEKNDKGYLTLNGIQTTQEQFTNNLTLTLKEAIKEAGGRGTPAGDAIGNLWHDIVSHESKIFNALKRLSDDHAAELEKVREEACLREHK